MMKIPMVMQQYDPDPSNRERSIPKPEEERHSQPEPNAPEPQDPLKEKVKQDQKDIGHGWGGTPH